jgi:hypothetical protein
MPRRTNCIRRESRSGNSSSVFSVLGL